MRNALQSACRTFHSLASGSRRKGSCTVPASRVLTTGRAAPSAAGRRAPPRRPARAGCAASSSRRTASLEHFEVRATPGLPLQDPPADSFLSTDRGLPPLGYWVDAALGTLNWALLPEGGCTGARLAAWISSNFATATYSETTNRLLGRRRRASLSLLRFWKAGVPTSPPGVPFKPVANLHRCYLRRDPVFLRSLLRLEGRRVDGASTPGAFCRER